MKKLPSVFANKIDKQINNNEKVYCSFNKEEIKQENNDQELISNNILSSMSKELDIRQKINKIFNSSNYIYKIDVNIKTKTDTLTKKIIGRNSKSLITIDNELIAIDDIIDISLVN